MILAQKINIALNKVVNEPMQQGCICSIDYEKKNSEDCYGKDLEACKGREGTPCKYYRHNGYSYTDNITLSAELAHKCHIKMQIDLSDGVITVDWKRLPRTGRITIHAKDYPSAYFAEAYARAFAVYEALS